ncbi:DNA phosphorothioation-dependent restriction protein DptG [Endozoicomonas atrinae]|uniref:DNA phosphorothioation-dependent restriction protein DptG n=1 Tax=Endozoicomonas atrinae TaxID=1333660 RepID=UPI00082475B8|nr:DNA phosphorothioation-dependent restriction protein DptG [Endozoicomonas atrinae]
MNLSQQIINALSTAYSGSKEKNNLFTYLPYRNKGNRFDYAITAGHTLGLIIGKELKPSFRFEKFQSKCLDEIGSLLSEESFLDHLEKMYFENNALQLVAPDFLLLRQSEKPPSASKHLSEIYESFMAFSHVDAALDSHPNFVETIILKQLQGHLKDRKPNEKQYPYLPYIAELFVKDLSFLCHKTDYLLQYSDQFLELYNFIYCSQMALNIRGWKSGQPGSKPLYFILDNEKAGQERTEIHRNGFLPLYKSSEALFPILSMLDRLNRDGDKKYPLWKFAEAIQEADIETQMKVTEIINAWAENFRDKNGLKVKEGTSENPAINALEVLIQYAQDQFDTQSSSRHEIRTAYQKEFEKQVCRHFVQSRGRSGRVLVLSQDYLLLLTNLIVGKQQKVHFQELLKGFRDRGVCFDKQSEKSLLTFYDRVGNVDRLSDSGDAVYVRSTI